MRLNEILKICNKRRNLKSIFLSWNFSFLKHPTQKFPWRILKPLSCIYFKSKLCNGLVFLYLYFHSPSELYCIHYLLFRRYNNHIQRIIKNVIWNKTLIKPVFIWNITDKLRIKSAEECLLQVYIERVFLVV